MGLHPEPLNRGEFGMGNEVVALSKYITPEIQDRIQTGLQQLQNAAHSNSADKGFWERDEEILKLLEEQGRLDLANHHWKNVQLAKIALVHSELSEAVEGIRTGNGPSDKLHEHGFNQAEEEMSDAVVRILDLCGKMNWKFPRAILTKMGYNTGREKLHGKAL